MTAFEVIYDEQCEICQAGVSWLKFLDQKGLKIACDYINAEIAKVRRRILTVGAVCMALALIVYSVMWNRGYSDPQFPIGGAVLIVLLFGAHQWRALNKTYKRILVTRVAAALGQGMTYSAESRFTKQDFIEMDLFEKVAEKWHAEDEVCRQEKRGHVFDSRAPGHLHRGVGEEPAYRRDLQGEHRPAGLQQELPRPHCRGSR